MVEQCTRPLKKYLFTIPVVLQVSVTFLFLFSSLSSSDSSCKQRGNNSDNPLSKVANKTMEGCRLKHKWDIVTDVDDY